MRPISLLRNLALDGLLWFCAPLLFLAAYASHHPALSEAVLPHLRIVLIGLLNLSLIRIMLYTVVRHPATLRIVSAICISALLFMVLSYYGLVLAGLKSWGQVITWDLISSYAAQMPETADALGMSLFVLLAAPAAIYAALVAGTWLYIRRFDWVPLLLPNMGGRLIALVIVSGSLISVLEVYKLTIRGSGGHEPVSLTFFPSQGEQTLQNHELNKLGSDQIDLRENEVRSRYQINTEAKRRNLILIVVDALRPQNMGIYGYERDTTPNLRRLTENSDARIVNDVRSVCSESLCGLLALSSSKYVHQFSNHPITLQQILKLHGYDVHMVLGGDHTNFYGLKQRYGQVNSYFDGSQAKGFYVNDDQFVLNRTAALPSWNEVPVLMQFHLMSSHILGKRHDRSIIYSPSASYMLPQNRAAEMSRQVVNFYDNGVVQTDTVIHELLETLKTKGYLENTLVVITGDHGEALGEHGNFIHANSIREEAVRIPLVMLSFGYRPAPLPAGRAAASQVDIAPTILAEFGMTRPETWAGFPLQESISRDYTYLQEAEFVGLLDHRDPHNLWKYWTNRKTGQEYAFNLNEDPGERQNAISTAPQGRKQEWRSALFQLRPVRQRERADQTPAH